MLYILIILQYSGYNFDVGNNSKQQPHVSLHLGLTDYRFFSIFLLLPSINISFKCMFFHLMCMWWKTIMIYSVWCNLDKLIYCVNLNSECLNLESLNVNSSWAYPLSRSWESKRKILITPGTHWILPQPSSFLLGFPLFWLMFAVSTAVTTGISKKGFVEWRYW